MSSDATLSTTFARLGLVAEYGIAWLLPRLVGLPVATDLLLSGRTVPPVKPTASDWRPAPTTLSPRL